MLRAMSIRFLTHIARDPSRIRLGIILAALAFALTATSIGLSAAAADAEPVLSGEQWARIFKRMDERGQTRALPSKVSETLGLTRGSETMNVREIAFEREGYQHGIYRSLGATSDRIILVFRTPEKKWMAFLTDTRSQLKTAIIWDAGEQPVRWPNDQASPIFDNEIGYWSVLAELL